jgi:DNA processing protein
MDRRTAFVALNLLSGIGPIRVNQLLSVFGEPEDVLAAPAGELARVPGIGSKLAGELANWRQQCDLEGELEMMERAGVEVLIRDDEDYPPLLQEIHDPPLVLYVHGSRQALRETRGSVAIVGSRHTSIYGQMVAQALSRSAATAGWPVVSGLARGIDTVAHDTVCQAGGVTLAVIGSGLAQLYPPENLPLARRIVDNGGAVISEFPMGYRPERRTFPMRNRIIAGISAGTIVVEAGDNSGSLITAACAMQQGRPVFAVPGRIDSAQSRGCHALIRDGATLVESFDDVIAELSLLPGIPRGTASPVNQLAQSDPPYINIKEIPLADLEHRVVVCLAQETEIAIDSLVALVEAPPGQVLAAIITLEMRRLVRQLPGRRVMLAVKLTDD